MKKYFILMTYLCCQLLCSPEIQAEISVHHHLPKAIESLKTAQQNYPQDHFFAFESSKNNQDLYINIKVLSDRDLQLVFACQPELPCQEKSFLQGDKKYPEFSQPVVSQLELGTQTALQKFARQIRRQGLDLSILKLIKAWAVVSPHDHHDHSHNHDHHASLGPDIWVKLNYQMNQQDKTTFIMCHFHGSETEMSCHFSQQGQHEPSF